TPTHPPHRHLHSFPTRRSSDLRQLLNDGSQFHAARTLGLRVVHIRFIVRPRRQLDPDKLTDPISAIMRGELPPERVLRLRRSVRSEEHTSELQSRGHLVCRLLL